jgi:hypothetical protein
MNIAYFPNQCARNSVSVMTAVINSLRRAGHVCVENSWDADAAVIWSVLWHGRMAGNQAVWTHYRQQRKPVICIDVGALYRGETWKIALNNITADGHYGHTENLDLDRPRKLGISLAINLSVNPQIVIAAQHADSLQVAKLDSIETWITEQIEQLQQVTDRPVVIRPHPRSMLNFEKLPKNSVIERPRRIVNTYDSYNLVFDCHAMINYNSGPGIQAALAGTRPVVDSSSLASPVGIELHNIEQPYTIDRDHWLVEICHTEYTVDEIDRGTWIDRICLVK